MRTPEDYCLSNQRVASLQAACAAHAAAGVWSPKHEQLAIGLAVASELPQVRFTTQGDFFYQPYRLLDGTGAVVAEDYRRWVKDQIAQGFAPAEIARSHWEKGWRLTWRGGSRAYFWAQTGHHPWSGSQLVVRVVQEFNGTPAFMDTGWGEPHDERDLINPQQGFDPEPNDSPISVHYQLEEAVDMAAFMRVGQTAYAARLQALSQQAIHVQPSDGASYATTLGAFAPEGMLVPWLPARWFEDWAVSSAGRSGAVAGQHWSFNISDTMMPVRGGEDMRVLEFIPLWSHVGKIERIGESGSSSAAELYSELQNLDKHTGVPFHWYFYLLHGNLVRADTGHTILTAANRGHLELPLHDLLVLKQWGETPYGF